MTPYQIAEFKGLLAYHFRLNEPMINVCQRVYSTRFGGYRYDVQTVMPGVLRPVEDRLANTEGLHWLRVQEGLCRYSYAECTSWYLDGILTHLKESLCE